MTLRILSISGLLSVLVGVSSLAAAEAGLFRSAPNPGPEGQIHAPATPMPPGAGHGSARSGAGLWRSPGWLRMPSAAPELDAAEPAEPAPQPEILGETPATPPQRTLIQRLRDRRLTQLERQIERLRESQRTDENVLPPASYEGPVGNSANPDIQIDLGAPTDVPLDGPANTTASNNVRVSARPPVVSADPPMDIVIPLPVDTVPPKPKPSLQTRMRERSANP